MGRRSSERPYHRPQTRRLQRDVQLTGPLAVGEPWRCGGLDEVVMVMVEAEAGAAMAAAAGRADRLDHPIASSIVGVHDDESWHGSTSDPKSSSEGSRHGGPALTPSLPEQHRIVPGAMVLAAALTRPSGRDRRDGYPGSANTPSLCFCHDLVTLVCSHARPIEA